MNSNITINPASHYLINLTIPDIDLFFASLLNSSSAISPLMENENYSLSGNLLCAVELLTGNKKIQYALYGSGVNNEISKKIQDYLKSRLIEIKKTMNIFFKLDFNIKLISIPELVTSLKKNIRIDIAVRQNENDIFLSLILPLDFFQLFSGKIIYVNSDIIEIEIINYFHNPLNLFPDIKILFSSLSELEIQKLFHHLRKSKLLTTYQISLLLQSFPSYRDLIKRNLSANTMSEVNKLSKKIRVDKRDLTEGVYSIEEAVYLMIKKNDNFTYSSYIHKIQSSMKTYLNLQQMIKKSFKSWIEEINSSGLLFYLLSITAEKDLLKIISQNSDFYYAMFSRYLPKKKLDEMFSIAENKIVSLAERLESQNTLILNYKKLKLNKLKINHGNFTAILSKFDAEKMLYLLFGVGWFTLSTALKNINRKNILYLIDKFPSGAKYLIIDVLEGIVNPNIIHDEMQIKKARTICVSEMLSLYEDGIINF